METNEGSMDKSDKLYFEEEIAATLSGVHRVLANRFNELCSGGKLNISHLVVLELLKEKGSSGMTELAKALNLTMGAATSIVDKMIELDLVKREHSKKDRRVVEVFLTKKGKDAALRTKNKKFDLVKDMISILTNDEKKQYLTLIKKIHSGLMKKND